MTKFIDVTKLVNHGYPDGEDLPITKCICGEIFSEWLFTANINEDISDRCPKCGRRYSFGIRVYEIKDE